MCVWSGGGTVSPTCMFIGVDIWDFDGFFWGVGGLLGMSKKERRENMQ